MPSSPTKDFSYGSRHKSFKEQTKRRKEQGKESTVESGKVRVDWLMNAKTQTHTHTHRVIAREKESVLEVARKVGGRRRDGRGTGMHTKKIFFNATKWKV